MILADTNIFLEVLLEQNAKERCKKFLNVQIGNLTISDFSLHSIGIILFNKGKHTIFNRFIQDILPYVPVHSLSKSTYISIKEIAFASKLDFDDAYQYSLASENEFEFATMDNDFRKVTDRLNVHFI